MQLYSENKNYKLYQGNMLDMLEVIESSSINSIVTDPPYELNFMSKGWDNSGIAFQKETWQKCYEVLKPGGYLLAFGGSRTFHRIACAIEDAGFEIRDTIMWLYGSGFPKSMNIGLAIDKKNGVESEKGERKTYADGSKQRLTGSNGPFGNNKGRKDYELIPTSNLAKKWQGWGTALKPSFEPIIVARKPFKGSLVDNVIEYGVGGINIDECRVETSDKYSYPNGGGGSSFGIGKGVDGTRTKPTESNPLGRFPANTILTYDDNDFDEVCGGFPNTKSTGGKGEATANTAMFFGNGNNGKLRANAGGLGDSGSASRYFYCAKASKKDRDEGLDEFEESKTTDGCIRTNQETARKFGANSALRKNTHPTVKPTNLMQYLVRLVTPNGGTILDPFNGSGSTGKAVMYENRERNKNYKYIGIELTEEYLPIAKARIEYVCNLKEEKEAQMSIFDLENNNE